MIDIPTAVIESLWALIIAVIAAVIAYLEKVKKDNAIAAYDVTSTQSSDPVIVASLPERTWKMSDSTKRWLTFDATPENKAKILAQKIHQVGTRLHAALTHVAVDGDFDRVDVCHGCSLMGSGGRADR